MAYQQLSPDQVETAAIGFKGPEGVVVDRETHRGFSGIAGDQHVPICGEYTRIRRCSG